MAPPSVVWEYFEKQVNEKKVTCKKCRKELTFCNSTSSLANHLLKIHKIIIPQQGTKRKISEANIVTSTVTVSHEIVDDPGAPASKTSNTNTAATCGVLQAPLQTPRCGPFKAWVEKSSSFGEGGHKRAEVNDALIYMIAADNMPFNTPEKKGLKMFVRKLNPLYHLPCEKTTTKLLEAKHAELKLKVGEMIRASKLVVLCTDLWTETMSARGFLGLTAHIVIGSKMHGVSLGARQMPQRKTIANLVDILSTMCNEWQIDPKMVTAIVTDRGANIKGACRQLFCPSKHIACFAHLINTVATEAIGFYCSSTNKRGAGNAPPPASNAVVHDAPEEDVQLPDDDDSDVDDIPDETEPSDLKDIVRKVKKIVSFFKNSEVAKTELVSMQMKEWNKPESACLKLVQEVRTRWNSMFLMIERYLLLSEFVGLILLKLSRDRQSTKVKPPQDLSAEEIDSLKEVKCVLKPLYEVTKELCAEKNVTLSKCIPLVKLMTKGIEGFMATDPVAFNLTARLLEQLNKHFGAIDSNMLYSVATMLDPRFKKMHLPPLAVANTMTRIKTLVQRKQTAIEEEMATPPREQEPADSALAVHGDGEDVDLWGHHDSLVAAQQGDPGVVAADQSEAGAAELRRYLNEPVCARSVNPLEEWDSRMKFKYPLLYEVAMDVLPVLATSVPAERLFSKAGILITKQRNRLSGKHVEQMLFLSTVDESLWFS